MDPLANIVVLLNFTWYELFILVRSTVYLYSDGMTVCMYISARAGLLVFTINIF